MPNNESAVASYIAITTGLEINLATLVAEYAADEAIVDLMTAPGMQESLVQMREITKQKAAPLIKSIDEKLTNETAPRKISHQILREINGYLAAYRNDTENCLVYRYAYDHIKNSNYVATNYVQKIELSCSYTIYPNNASIFPELLKKHPDLQPLTKKPMTDDPTPHLALSFKR